MSILSSTLLNECHFSIVFKFSTIASSLSLKFIRVTFGHSITLHFFSLDLLQTAALISGQLVSL